MGYYVEARLVVLLLILQVLLVVQGQESSPDPMPQCLSGEGLKGVKRRGAILGCIKCPPKSFSKYNRVLGNRVCEPCRRCGDSQQEVQQCSGDQDTVCGSRQTSTPGVSVWNQRTITESQAIVIVTSVAAILCGAMIFTMVVIWLHGRCAQAQKKRARRAPPLREPQNTVLGYKGPYSSILLPADENKAPCKSPLEGVFVSNPYEKLKSSSG